MNHHLSRRRFLGTACRLSTGLLAGGALSSLAGCGSGVESRQSTIARARTAHKQLSGLPANPVAVVQNMHSLMYPPIGDPRDYDRENNPCYPLVEEALMLLNPDDLENPLGNLVHPGDVVVIKPNWCTQYLFPLPITHPSLVHAVAEMAARAGAAKVRIVEAPMTMTYAATWFYGRTFLNIKDWLSHLSQRHPNTVFEHQDGNADQFTWVRIASNSLLREIPLDALRHDNGGVLNDIFFEVPDSRGFEPKGYEHGLYAIANSYLDSDVFINFPKMKTHTWTGITVAIKNLMGLNLMSTLFRLPPERTQDYLAATQDPGRRENKMRDVPHHDGRYSKLKNLDQVAPTNDVLWRSLADLNRIIHFCDRTGHMHESQQRRYLNIVDGIIGIEGDGPISGYRVNSGTIIAGADPVRVDAVASHLMGYDPMRIPLVRNSADLQRGYSFGEMGDYLHAIVTAEPGEMPKARHYAEPVNWGATDKSSMSVRKA